jgi:hypothetical protein
MHKRGGAPQKEIDGTQFAFGTIPAETALDVVVSISRLFAAPLAALAAGAGEKTSEAEQVAAVMSAVAAFARHPDHLALKAELRETLATLLKWVAADGNKELSINYFTGRNVTLWKVAVEQVRQNFADFFGASRSTSRQEETPA